MIRWDLFVRQPQRTSALHAVANIGHGQILMAEKSKRGSLDDLGLKPLALRVGHRHLDAPLKLRIIRANNLPWFVPS
jgi:hypothetical protein